MRKFEHIPDTSKQDNDQCHAFERREIKHGQIQEKWMVPFDSLALKT